MTTTNLTSAWTTAYVLNTPGPITCLAFLDNLLVAGSEDGQIRVYALEDEAASVRNRIASTSDEIGSLAWMPRRGKATPERLELWAASGSQLCRFEIGESSDAPILRASESISPLRDDEDVVGKIAIDERGSHLAYATEDGVVGVISLSADRRKTVMWISHNSICDCLAFLPSAYPWQLISAGYDYRIIQHDYSRGTLSSQLSLDEVAPTQDNISMSPPFFQSLHIAPNGDLACGLANGEIYVAQASPPGAKKKDKKRKWSALRGHGVRHQAAEGPIVGIYHMDESSLLACTLLGRLLHFRIGPTWQLLRSESVGSLAKVNAVGCNGKYLAAGGITADGKGAVVIKRMSLANEEPVQ